MEYLANHRVPVELNVGDKLMSSLTSDISGFQVGGGGRSKASLRFEKRLNFTNS